MKDPDKEYCIVTTGDNLYLESYMGDSAICTTNKERVFKFDDSVTASPVAEKYSGRVKSQYDWFSDF